MRRVALLLVVLACIAAPAAATALPSMPSSTFTPSTGCGCHSAFMEEWKVSMHAKALSDPLYNVKLKEASTATDGALDPFCTSCHAPAAVMAGEIDGLDSSRASAVGIEGVGCDFCHHVTGTEGGIGNASVRVAQDAVRRAQLKDPQAPHPAAYEQFHETAEFCGNCHNVDHPVNGMHLEATYTEWKNGPYAAEGIVCQDCHLTPGPGVTKPNPGKAAGMGPQRDHIYTMTFAGGNVGLGDAVRAEERLKAAATLDLVAPELVESGDVSVTTSITNVGAGHYLPTGLTEVRQMWLEVTATDEDGNELLAERRDFGTVLQDAAGNAPVELWDATQVASDDRIAPRESATNEYSFPMSGAAVTVEATLYYRSCSEEMAGTAGVEIPTTTMARATKVVYSSAAARNTAASSDADEGEGSPFLVWALVAVGVALAIVTVWVHASRRE